MPKNMHYICRMQKLKDNPVDQEMDNNSPQNLNNSLNIIAEEEQIGRRKRRLSIDVIFTIQQIKYKHR